VVTRPNVVTGSAGKLASSESSGYKPDQTTHKTLPLSGNCEASRLRSEVVISYYYHTAQPTTLHGHFAVHSVLLAPFDSNRQHLNIDDLFDDSIVCRYQI